MSAPTPRDVSFVPVERPGRSAPGSSARSQVLRAVRRTRRVYARDEKWNRLAV